MTRTRWWGAAVALAAAALIGSGTLSGSSETTPPPWCLRCALASEGLAADVIVNVLLFVPLGLGLRLAGLGVATVTVLGFAVSLLIEVTQAYVLAGRVANVFDLATNTLGAALAAAVTPKWRTMIFPTASQAASLTHGSTGVAVGIVALTAWALTPAVPPGVLVACGIESVGASARPERVVGASVEGRAVTSGDTVQARGVHERPVRVDVALQASRFRWRDEPAFMLVSGGPTFIQLGIDASDLELEVRRRGEAARFRSPSVRVRRPARSADATAAAQLDTLLLRGVADQWRMSLSVHTRDTDDRHEVRLHPIAGWSLFLNAPRSARPGELLTALWTAALFFPVAFWSAVAANGRLRIRTLLPPCAIGAVMGATGAFAGAPPPPWSAITGAGVALVAAWGLQRLLKHHVAGALSSAPHRDRHTGHG